MTKTRTIEDGRTLPIFIHSEVDDLGLDPYTFRIYGHLARRVGTRPHVLRLEAIAEHCAISLPVVKRSIKALLTRHMVERERRPGYASVYTLTDIVKWVNPAPTTTKTRGTRTGYPGNHRYDPQATTDTTPRQPQIRHEGTPKEGTPEKERERALFLTSRAQPSPRTPTVDELTQPDDPGAGWMTPEKQAARYVLKVCGLWDEDAREPMPMAPMKYQDVQTVAAWLNKHNRLHKAGHPDRFVEYWRERGRRGEVWPLNISENWTPFQAWLTGAQEEVAA